MRLAAISDTHGNAVALAAVLADLKRQAPDAIVFLGDACGRGPHPLECVQMIRELNPLVAVRGNWDHAFTRWPEPGWTPKSYQQEVMLRALRWDAAQLPRGEQEWLANRPLQHVLEIEGKRVELFHAAPDSLFTQHMPWVPLDQLCQARIGESPDLVLFGHVHHPYIRQARGTQMVNSGSIGMPFDGDNRASYAVVDIAADDLAVQIRRVAYAVEAAIEGARQVGMPDLDAFTYAVRRAQYPYSSPERV